MRRFLIIILFSSVAGQAQDLTLCNHKGKEVVLQQDKILGLSTVDWGMWGTVTEITDSTISINTLWEGDDFPVDTVVTYYHSEITGLIYCRSDKEKSCNATREHPNRHKPIIVAPTLVFAASAVVAGIIGQIEVMAIAAGLGTAWFVSTTIMLRPKFYNTSKWQIGGCN